VKPTPDHCTDAEIHALFDALNPSFAATVAALDAVAPLVNPETLASGRVNEIAPVIDLRRRYSIRYEHHGSHRGVHHWTCIDEVTYDGPESDIGTGESPQEALLDLLEKLAARAVRP
jgi:hypothetical protein